MARSTNSGGSGRLPLKSEARTVPIKSYAKLSRRKWTLIAITILLNILFYSSLICVFTAIYQIASDLGNTTNIASEVLTLTSALATLAYINLHSIFSFKQRIWRHQGRHPSVDKKTSYVAVRFAGTLCTLWLLTSGWNMILVARRPTCLPETSQLDSWEAGKTCQVDRAGIAFAMIALMASCALFGMLSTVRRPFEAHLLNYNYSLPTSTPNITPSVSRRPSPSRSMSGVSKKYHRRGISASTHQSMPSNVSNTDVDTLDLNNSTSPPATIVAPAPTRSVGLGIFTSQAQPPPLPPLPLAFATPPSVASLEPPPPVFRPSVSSPHLPLPPRMSLMKPSAYVPMSIPAQYSASAWRAVHPTAPSPLGPAASRSYSHLPLTNSGPNVTYRTRFSRSSISLTRPHRLSGTTPASSGGWTSRSGSTAPDDRRGSPTSENDAERDATASEVAYAILNGTSIPGTEASKARPTKHLRHASAPDAGAGAQLVSRAWKPRLQGQVEGNEECTSKLGRASSADLLDGGIAQNEADDGKSDGRLSVDKFLPFRKMRSADPIRCSPNAGGTPRVSRAATSASRVSLGSGGTGSSGGEGRAGERRMTFDEVKNKPLPRIAVL